MTYPVREDTLLLKRKVEELPLEGKKVLEIGTGNGIVAVTAAEKGAGVTATDIDPEALEDARERAEKSDVSGKLKFLESNLFEEIEGSFDYILFNPPYLPGKKEVEDDSTWRGGEKGIEITKKFLEAARDHLEEEGEIYFVASSRSRIEDLDRDIEQVDREKLWFEKLYLFKSD